VTKNIMTALLCAITIAGCVGAAGVAESLQARIDEARFREELRAQQNDTEERRISKALKEGRAAAGAKQ
jgi:hypothetical protein